MDIPVDEAEYFALKAKAREQAAEIKRLRRIKETAVLDGLEKLRKDLGLPAAEEKGASDAY